MALNESAGIIASYATAIGVAFAAWQIWRNAEQSRTAFEDALAKEYRELIRAIPYAVILNKNIPEIEAQQTKELIYNYLDFCNQQAYLRSKKRIRESTWYEWQAGMKLNLSLSLFHKVANEVFDAHPEIFEELRRVKSNGFIGDPAHWG